MKGYWKYYQVIRTLREKCHSRYPVVIRRVEMSDCWGECYFDEDKKKFIIHIDKNMSQDYAIDTVLHEIAHIFTYKKRQLHGKDWGIAYSRIYRIFEKEFLS